MIFTDLEGKKPPQFLDKNMKNPTIVAAQPCAGAAWPLTER